MTRNRDIATILGLTEADNTENVSLGAGGGGGGGVTLYDSDGAILLVDSSGLTSGDLAYSDTDNTFAIWNDSDGNWKQITFAEYELGGGPPATGGTMSQYIDGAITYQVHTFDTSGDFVVSENLTDVEYLVIAGGGSGGGYYYSGGGGAGGYRTSLTGATSGRNSSAEAKLSLIPGTYSVLIGAGGANQDAALQGNDGSDTTFTTIVSLGGGGGGLNANGSNGGSGGGAGQGSNRQGGSGTAGQGFDGGDLSSSGNTYGGGGGGGAGEIGENGASGAAGDGGDGLSMTFSGGSAVTRAGGGGGGSGANAGKGTGGAGGGGDGGAYSGGITPQDGAVNTGSGGGGSSHAANASKIAGAGGSGLVLIRYAI